MRKFGDFSELSESSVQAIEKIINGIESKGLPCSLFYGFPLIELDNSSTIMKGCIISTKGVLILHSLKDINPTLGSIANSLIVGHSIIVLLICLQ